MCWECSLYSLQQTAQIRKDITSSLGSQHSVNSIDHVLRLRDSQRLQVERVGHRDVDSGDSLQRRIEVVESVRYTSPLSPSPTLHAQRGDLGADARLRPALLHSDDMVGLLDAVDDSLAVHGADRA